MVNARNDETPTQLSWRKRIRALIEERGLYRSEITQTLKDEGCRYTWVRLDRMIRSVEDDFADDVGDVHTNAKRNLGVSLYRYSKLYEKAQESGEIRLAFQIQQFIDKLQQLVVTKRIKPKTGIKEPEADPDDLSGLSDEELRAMTEKVEA